MQIHMKMQNASAKTVSATQKATAVRPDVSGKSSDFAHKNRDPS